MKKGKHEIDAIHQIFVFCDTNKCIGQYEAIIIWATYEPFVQWRETHDTILTNRSFRQGIKAAWGQHYIGHDSHGGIANHLQVPVR